jgi:hypothetical protein
MPTPSDDQARTPLGRRRFRPAHRPTAGPERGQASLELVAMLPLLIFGGLLVLQMGVAMWAVSSTNEAARQAARAYSLGADPAGAAEGSLPGGLDVEGLVASGPGHRVELTVAIPRLLPLPLPAVTRVVVMP